MQKIPLHIGNNKAEVRIEVCLTRSIHARIQTKLGNVTVVECHAPTNDAEEKSNNDFFARLQTVIADRKVKGGSKNSEGQEWNGAHKPRWPTKDIC